MSIALGIRLFVAVLFLRTAWHKLHDAKQFRAELTAYRLLPDALVPTFVWLLGIAEISCALLLFNITNQSGLWLALGLLVIYSCAMGINLARGRRDIDCGCSTSLSVRKTLDGWLLVRNALLILLAAICLWIPTTGDMATLDYAQALLIAVTLSLTLESFEQALTNAQRHSLWQRRRTA